MARIALACFGVAFIATAAVFILCLHCVSSGVDVEITPTPTGDDTMTTQAMSTANPYDHPDPPCDICGRDPYDCVCPTCPMCGAQGDPGCYERHGLLPAHPGDPPTRGPKGDDDMKTNTETRNWCTDYARMTTTDALDDAVSLGSVRLLVPSEGLQDWLNGRLAEYEDHDVMVCLGGTYGD